MNSWKERVAVAKLGMKTERTQFNILFLRERKFSKVHIISKYKFKSGKNVGWSKFLGRVLFSSKIWRPGFQ